jgi:hypothetical protein
MCTAEAYVARARVMAEAVINFIVACWEPVCVQWEMRSESVWTVVSPEMMTSLLLYISGGLPSLIKL